MSDDSIYRQLGEIVFTEFAKSAYANQVLSNCPKLAEVLAKPVLKRNLPKMLSQFSLGVLINSGYSYGDIAEVINDYCIANAQEPFKEQLRENPVLKGSIHSLVQRLPGLIEKKQRAPKEYSFAPAARTAGENAREFIKQLVTEFRRWDVNHYSNDDYSRVKAEKYLIDYPGTKWNLQTLESVFLADITGVPKKDIAARTGISSCGVYQILRRSYPGRDACKIQLTAEQKEYVASHPELTASKIGRKCGVSHHVIDRYAKENGIELLKSRKPLTLEQRAFIAENKHQSASQIASALKVKSYMVRNYAKREGIELYKPVLPDPREMAEVLRNAGIIGGRVVAK